MIITISKLKNTNELVLNNLNCSHRNKIESKHVELTLFKTFES